MLRASILSTLLIVGATAGETMSAASPVVRVDLLAASADHATVLVELAGAGSRARDVTASVNAVGIDLGPMQGPVKPQRWSNADAASPVAAVAISPLLSGSEPHARVDIALRCVCSHALRTSGRYVYVDVARPRPRPAAQQPEGTSGKMLTPDVRPKASSGGAAGEGPAPSDTPPPSDPASADAAYRALETETLDRARTLAAVPDVKALLALHDAVVRRDEHLGRQRPEVVGRLLAELARFTDAARTRQLELDRDAIKKAKTSQVRDR